jgi:hypothetical protein
MTLALRTNVNNGSPCECFSRHPLEPARMTWASRLGRPRPQPVRLALTIWWTCIALGTLFLSGSTYAQESNGVAQKFLQRHGVPCLFVLKVGSPGGMEEEIATCQDKREWALFWLEGEIAFVHPHTREPYKWDRQIYVSHPEIYSGANPSNESPILFSCGP